MVVVSHRWLSFAIGALLLIIATTGAAVVYSPEWTRWTNASTFQVTDSDRPVPMSQALTIVSAAHPEFAPGLVNVYSGLYEVHSSDSEAHPGFYGVDPGTGAITGFVNPDRGVMALMLQVHECFFTCADNPGYLAVLDDSVPTLGMQWLEDVTWGGLLLGVTGLFLLFLAVSGLVLWWPGIKRISHGFRVRTGKGRYARDYDLHQLVGLAAVPFLLIWGLTGASFEFHWVNTAWYAVTGGQQIIEPNFESRELPNTQAPDITAASAITAAQARAGTKAELVYLSIPASDDPTATFDVWFSEKFDQYRYGSYPGQLEIQVDRHDATRIAVNDYGTAPTLSNKLLDSLGGATLHYGQSFNGWWRIFWFVFGLTPLALAVTGISTWLAKRTVRKRRRAAATAAAVPPELVSVAGPVASEPPK